MFDSHAQYRITYSAHNTQNLHSKLEELQPDFLLLDLSLSHPAPLETLDFICSEKLTTKTIALTMNTQCDTAMGLLEQGIAGYVLKEDAFDSLEKALAFAQRGDVFISTEMRHKLEAYQARDARTHKLTQKEKSVLALAAQGLTNQEIADTLFVSERTVRFHLSNVCLKLNAIGKTHAVAVAVQSGKITI